MPLPEAETLVLEALRGQADRPNWHERNDGWAKVALDDARADLSAGKFESATFESGLNVLRTEGFYKDVDSESGLVDMGELPPQTE